MDSLHLLALQKNVCTVSETTNIELKMKRTNADSSSDQTVLGSSSFVSVLINKD